MTEQTAMAANAALIREKLDQAVEILNELEIDAWMTFVRETSLTPDPALDLIFGNDMVWQSAFIITRDDQRIAIIGKHDAENVENIGGYTRIIPYVQGLSGHLKEVLTELDPQTLALNYSVNDVAADGLSHGLMQLLHQYLADTGLPERFVSAEGIIGALRGRKSPTEIERIKQAVETTQAAFQEVCDHLQVGRSEVELQQIAHNFIGERRLGTAWDYDYCPTISAGPDSVVGHAGPDPKLTVQPGTLVHMDFGVKQNEYCADLQRIWYIRREGETEPPEDLQKAFRAARKALHAGMEALKPGAQGWQVDEAARSALVAEGYPEYQFAFGHHVGRVAHDGATVLGPRWERYGQTPYGVIEVGNVFAIELGIYLEDYGYIGQEENVLVTDEGAVWLSEPQEELWLP